MTAGEGWACGINGPRLRDFMRSSKIGFTDYCREQGSAHIGLQPSPCPNGVEHSHPIRSLCVPTACSGKSIHHTFMFWMYNCNQLTSSIASHHGPPGVAFANNATISQWRNPGGYVWQRPRVAGSGRMVKQCPGVHHWSTK